MWIRKVCVCVCVYTYAHVPILIQTYIYIIKRNVKKGKNIKELCSADEWIFREYHCII